MANKGKFFPKKYAPELTLQETMFYLSYWPNRRARRAAPAWLKKLSTTSDWESQHSLWEMTHGE